MSRAARGGESNGGAPVLGPVSSRNPGGHGGRRRRRLTAMAMRPASSQMRREARPATQVS